MSKVYTIEEIIDVIIFLEDEGILKVVFNNTKELFSKKELLRGISETEIVLERMKSRISIEDYNSIRNKLNVLSVFDDYDETKEIVEKKFYESFAALDYIVKAMAESDLKHEEFLNQMEICHLQILESDRENTREIVEILKNHSNIFKNKNAFNHLKQALLHDVYRSDAMLYATNKFAPVTEQKLPQIIRECFNYAFNDSQNDVFREELLPLHAKLFQNKNVQQHYINYIKESEIKGLLILKTVYKKMLELTKWSIPIKMGLFKHINNQKFDINDKNFINEFLVNYEELNPETICDIFRSQHDGIIDMIDDMHFSFYRLVNHSELILDPQTLEVKINSETFSDKVNYDMSPIRRIYEEGTNRIEVYLNEYEIKTSEILNAYMERLNTKIGNYQQSKKNDLKKSLISGILGSPIYLGKVIYEEFTVHDKIKESTQQLLNVYYDFIKSIESLEKNLINFYLNIISKIEKEYILPTIKNLNQQDFVIKHYGINNFEKESINIIKPFFNMYKDTPCLNKSYNMPNTLKNNESIKYFV